MVGGKIVPPPPPPPQYKRDFKSFIFVSFQQITSKLANFINLKALFPAESIDSSLLVHVKSYKNPWEGLWETIFFKKIKGKKRWFRYGHHSLIAFLKFRLITNVAYLQINVVKQQSIFCVFF